MLVFLQCTAIVGLLATLISCQLLPDNMFRFLNHANLGESRHKLHGVPTPPPHDQKALTARYVVHVSNWGVVATISVQSEISGLPYANVFSFADGVLGNSSYGTPFFFMTPMDVSAQDIAQNPAVTLVASEAQSDICDKKQLDPESPVCARVMLTGIMERITNEEDVSFARHILFTRHPAMSSWPKSHQWFFAKLIIKQIQLLDFYGGITNVPLEDYFAAKLYDDS